MSHLGISKSAYAKAVRAAVPPPGFGHHVNMEGFLFPATYEVSRRRRGGAGRQQLAAFDDNFSRVDMARRGRRT